MSERTVTSADGHEWTADEFAGDYTALLPMTMEGFVDFLRTGFGIEGYERIHELLEKRAQTLGVPRSWREGEDLDRPHS